MLLNRRVLYQTVIVDWRLKHWLRLGSRFSFYLQSFLTAFLLSSLIYISSILFSPLHSCCNITLIFWSTPGPMLNNGRLYQAHTLTHILTWQCPSWSGMTADEQQEHSWGSKTNRRAASCRVIVMWRWFPWRRVSRESTRASGFRVALEGTCGRADV